MDQKRDITHGAEPKRTKRTRSSESKRVRQKGTEKNPGWVAQSVERTVDNGKAVGSTPTSPSEKEPKESEKRKRDEGIEPSKKKEFGGVSNQTRRREIQSRSGWIVDKNESLPRSYRIAI